MLTIHSWKRNTHEVETIFEIPYSSARVKDIFLIQGGRVVGEQWNTMGKYGCYLVALLDAKIDDTFRILKEMRNNGTPLDDSEFPNPKTPA